MFKIEKMIRDVYSKIFGIYDIENLIDREVEDNWKILDAGCGRFSSLRNIKKGCYKVGLDFYEPYINESKKNLIHDEYVLGDIRKMPFSSNSFDCVASIDVLEHLEKIDGLKMIKEMERVATKKIILTTPNGFLPTYAGPKDNPEESHLSGWTSEELKKLGFKVYGSGGLKILWTIKNGQATGKIRIPILSGLLINLSEFIAYHFPSLAFQLYFFKNLDKK